MTGFGETKAFGEVAATGSNVPSPGDRFQQSRRRGFIGSTRPRPVDQWRVHE